MYKDQASRQATFLGMITCDDNVGKARELLKDLGIYEDTILFYHR